MSRAAAAALVKEIRRHLSQGQGALTIGLCGGTSPAELFPPFIELFADVESLLRARVHFVLVDERRVPLTDDQSNYSMLKQKLFNPLLKQKLIHAEQVHPFPVELKPEAAADQYTRLVRHTLGGLHIAILGVGPDGHVAGIFPRHTSARREGSAYYYVPDRPKPPTEGFSASRELLCACRVGFVFFWGPEKKKALEDYLSGADPIDEPARVAKFMQRSYVVTDIAE